MSDLIFTESELVARDREVAAKALRDAAERIDRHPWSEYMMATPGAMLRLFADRIESQANEKGAGDVQ